MQFKAIVDGQERLVEMNSEQMWAVFYAMQESLDKDDLSLFLDMDEGHDHSIVPDCLKEKARSEISQIASFYRHSMNNSEDWLYSAEYAVHRWVHQQKEES